MNTSLGVNEGSLKDAAHFSIVARKATTFNLAFTFCPGLGTREGLLVFEWLENPKRSVRFHRVPAECREKGTRELVNWSKVYSKCAYIYYFFFY